MMIADPYPDPH